MSSVCYPQTAIPRLALIFQVSVISAPVLFCWAGSWMGSGDPEKLNETGHVMKSGWAAGGAQTDGAISESRGFGQEALARNLGS